MKKYFKELERLDVEYPDQKPTIKKIDAVSIEFQESILICTEWANGDGYELSYDDNYGHEKRLSLHRDEVEALLRALKEINYF